MGIGYKLKKLRVERGLTLEKLADLFTEKYNTGTLKNSISRWENDKQAPSFSTLNMYCNLFNVSLDYFKEENISEQMKTYNKLETEISMLSDNQKDRLNAFIQSNSIMFFNSNGNEDKETKELIEKALTESFIKILKQKGEL